MPKDEIINYYQNNINKIILPWDSSHRQYRIKTYEGQWRKIKRRIKTPKDLQPYLLKYAPTAVYYSIACWLDPLTMGSKLNSKSILLHFDLAFDIDAKKTTLKSLDHAKKTTLKIHDYVSRKYELLYCAFSSNRGFHLLFKDNIQLPADPRIREDFLIKNRKIYIDKLIRDIKVKFDTDISINTRGIIRVPGTLGKSGMACTILPPKDSQLPIEQLLKRINKAGPVRIQKDPMIGYLPVPKITARKEAPGPASPGFEHYYSAYITNQVCGIKNRYISIFVYHKEFPYKKQLLFLQKAYDLGDIDILGMDDLIIAISTKTFSKERLKKIYKRSKAINTNEFEKLKEVFVRIIPKFAVINKEMTEINPAPKFIETLEGNNTSFKSRGHVNILKYIFKINHQYKNLHGSKIVIMSTAKKRV